MKRAWRQRRSLRPIIAAWAALSLYGPFASATDLWQAWQATRQHAPDMAVAEAGRAAALTLREQAAALERPQVVLQGTGGLMSSNTSMQGASFSAPGFGQSTGVNFATSVNGAAGLRWSIGVRHALLDRERDAQTAQMRLGADAADLPWLAARQELMLELARRYFEVLLAQRHSDLLRQQHIAVARAYTEARDRFSIGDSPVTDTHEASARARALEAQGLSADNRMRDARDALSDLTGLPTETMAGIGPDTAVLPIKLAPLSEALQQARDTHPELRWLRVQADSAAQEALKYSPAAGTHVDLVAQAGRERLSGSGEFGSATLTQSQNLLGVAVTLPLYTGGWREARLNEARYRADQARAQVERTRVRLEQHTRTTWLTLASGPARIEALVAALHASQARLEATRLGRQVGDRTTQALLNAENDASAAELSLVEARIGILLARLQLDALTGQLDEPRLQSVNAVLRP